MSDSNNEKHADEIEIAGIIFRHGDNDYGLWEGFSFTEDEITTINQILRNHETEGCSIRGTKKDIADDFAS